MTQHSPDDFAHALKDKKWEQKVAPADGGMARFLGAILLLAGLGGAWALVWVPVQAALAHEPSVRFLMKPMMALPLLLGLGILLLARGGSVAAIFDDQSKSRLRWVIAALVIAGIAFGLGMRYFFAARGYS